MFGAGHVENDARFRVGTQELCCQLRVGRVDSANHDERGRDYAITSFGVPQE